MSNIFGKVKPVGKEIENCKNEDKQWENEEVILETFYNVSFYF